MSAHDCAIILLASGMSRRFGREDKLLARLSGKAVIDHTLAPINEIGFGMKVAVISLNPPDDTTLEDKLTQAGFEIVINPTPESGQGRSLALGVDAVLAAGFNRACIVLADMPCIPHEHFTALLALAETCDRVVTQTQSDVEPIKGPITLPPCIFSGASLQRLTQARGDKGAKQYWRGHDVAIQKLSYWAAKDIDTPQDLEALDCHMNKRKT